MLLLQKNVMLII
jgi:hypothetical protein